MVVVGSAWFCFNDGLRSGEFLVGMLGDRFGSGFPDELPWLVFLLGRDGLVFALAPLAVTKAALFLLPLLNFLSTGLVGDVGDIGSVSRVGDLSRGGAGSGMDSSFFKLGGALVDDPEESAISRTGSAVS